MSNEASTTVVFPTTTNAQALREAVEKALADDKFMGNSNKINNAVEALTPKDTLTGTLKRLQGNANKDFLDKKDKGIIGYTEPNRAEKIKAYVQDKFQSYMDNPKTSEKAIKLFNEAYAVKIEEKAPEEETNNE